VKERRRRKKEESVASWQSKGWAWLGQPGPLFACIPAYAMAWYAKAGRAPHPHVDGRVHCSQGACMHVGTVSTVGHSAARLGTGRIVDGGERNQRRHRHARLLCVRTRDGGLECHRLVAWMALGTTSSCEPSRLIGAKAESRGTNSAVYPSAASG
jgi:hypothetical protein